MVSVHILFGKFLIFSLLDLSPVYLSLKHNAVARIVHIRFMDLKFDIIQTNQWVNHITENESTKHIPNIPFRCSIVYSFQNVVKHQMRYEHVNPMYTLPQMLSVSNECMMISCQHLVDSIEFGMYLGAMSVMYITKSSSIRNGQCFDRNHLCTLNLPHQIVVCSVYTAQADTLSKVTAIDSPYVHTLYTTCIQIILNYVYD